MSADAPQPDVSALLGRLLLAIEGPSGLLNRMKAVENRCTALEGLTDQLADAIIARESDKSTVDLVNELADLRLQIAKLANADKYTLTREGLGRLMLAHGLVQPQSASATPTSAPEPL